NGGYTPWTEWTECSATCGGGIQQRTRACSNPAPKNNGTSCESLGPSFETQACNSKPCPVDGGFSEWGNYTECSVTCGGGTQMRLRTCTNPQPANGGRPCLGETTETKDCNLQPC
ncbi:predicted protein, partial [Nematostella vectensis]